MQRPVVALTSYCWIVARCVCVQGFTRDTQSYHSKLIAQTNNYKPLIGRYDVLHFEVSPCCCRFIASSTAQWGLVNNRHYLASSLKRKVCFPSSKLMNIAFHKSAISGYLLETWYTQRHPPIRTLSLHIPVKILPFSNPAPQWKHTRCLRDTCVECTVYDLECTLI